MDRSRSIFIYLSPLLALGAGYLGFTNGLPDVAAISLGITVLTVLWWITEAIPIPIASLVPITLFPLLGVLNAKTAVAQSYGHPLILLLLGGFLLSKGMEKSGVHRRLALNMVHLCRRGGHKGIVLGFMLAASVLSMWISNTATTLMLLPIAMAVLSGARETNQREAVILAAPLMLGIAYAANIGGLGSPIGTPPNLVFIERYREASGQEVSFLEWMKLAVPIVIIMVPLMWLWITRGLSTGQQIDLPETGRWQPKERRTLIVFGLTVLAWVTRKEPFGGWSTWWGLPGANDASVAFLGVLLLFCLPDGTGRKGTEGKLLDWETAQKIPWGVLLLFAGGICLAKGIDQSGLGKAVAASLQSVGTWPVLVTTLTICLLMTFVTEVTSNTASTIVMLPILAGVAASNELNPMILMLPATFSASCAFMLPVATAPNAVVFGTGSFTIQRMMREGLVLNLAGVVVIGLYSWLVL